MAENQEDRSREDLTEEASPHRIEEYRRKGMVAQSKEISGMLALLATGVAAYALAPSMGAQMVDLMREVFRTDLSARVDLGQTHVLAALLMRAFGVMLKIGLPVALAGFVLGAFGSFAQIGALFTTEPLAPDLTKIDPIQGMKRMFSMNQIIEGVRLTIKVIIVVAVSYSLIKTQVLISPQYLGQDPASYFEAYGHAGKVVFLSLMGILAVFAGIDYGVQRWQFSKNVRMTKQEAKQEHREREGDPQIKSRIRMVQREMARKRMMSAVKKADVIVTNPTHIAVALVYDKGKMAAPTVVAKGADFLAQRIKKIAADAGVPLVENVPLARALYKNVKVGKGIPKNLYQAVAEVLAYVYRLKNRGV